MIGISVPEGEAAENWSARKKDRGNAILPSFFVYRLQAHFPFARDLEEYHQNQDGHSGQHDGECGSGSVISSNDLCIDGDG